MKNNPFLILCFAILTACSANPIKVKSTGDSYVVNGRNYTHAIYNRAALLTTYPVAAFDAANRRQDITDVYVVSHGWNYTITEALAMYRKYIDAIERQLADNHHPEFKPYFIFVVWPSTIKPLTDTVSGILPYGLDETFKPLTGLIDNMPMHIVTTWKQTINAKNIAIGKGYTKDFGNETAINAPYIVDGDQSGMDFPVSKLVFELMEKSRRQGNSFRIHLVGHSYGAKLALFSGAEASRQWAKSKGITHCMESDTPIGSDFFSDTATGKTEIQKCAQTQPSLRPPLESIVLFNTAMTPNEIAYQTGTLETANNLAHLALIPRKAFVYSSSDYANGLLFNIREALTGGAVAQVYEDIRDSIDLNGAIGNDLVYQLFLPLRMVGNTLGGAFSLVTASGLGFIDYAASVAVNVPMDFYHHVSRHEISGESPSTEDWPLAAPLALANTLDYFLPIYPWPFDRQEDDLGLFRSTKPGLGKTGLVRLAKGRLQRFNLRDFSPFYDESADISASIFNELCVRNNGNPALPDLKTTGSPVPVEGENLGVWGADKFFSFNAGEVYDSPYIPIVGSHGDLRSGKTEEDHSKIRKTVNFIFNYTTMKDDELRRRLTAR